MTLSRRTSRLACTAAAVALACVAAQAQAQFKPYPAPAEATNIVSADVASTDKVEITGRHYDNSVDRVFTGTAVLKDLGPWSVSLTERYIGSGALTSDNSMRSSSSLVSNLRVSRKLSSSSALTLDLLNLFDRRYKDIECYYATQLSGEAATINDKVVHPGEPRNVRLRVSF